MNKSTKRGSANSYLTHTKKQNGITLIALIITIIVMLILVGVTINVALNGGLFIKAKQAATQTQKEADRELLQSALVSSLNNEQKIENAEALENTLPDGWTVTGSDGGPYTCTSPDGNVFKVDKDRNITDIDPSAFSWEYLGLTVTTGIEYQSGNATIVFTDDGKINSYNNGVLAQTIDATDEKNLQPGENGKKILTIEAENPFTGETIHLVWAMNENGRDIDYKQQGASNGNTFVKTTYDNITIYSNEEVLRRLGITNNTGTYTGTWKKIGETDDGIKLATTRAVTEYLLGYGDPEAIENVSVADENALTDAEKLERSIYSYQNAVSSLNTATQNVTGIATARSITLEDVCEILGKSKEQLSDSNYGKMYKYSYHNADETNSTSAGVYYEVETTRDSNGNVTAWSTPEYTGYTAQTFVDNNGNKVVVDSEGDEVIVTNTKYFYVLTNDEKTKLGNLANTYVWYASPSVECRTMDCFFLPGAVGFGLACNLMDLTTGSVFESNSTASASPGAVFAVVTIPKF